MSTVMVRFVRKDANIVAHAMARIPYFQVIFMSFLTCLLEALSFDITR